MRDGSIRPSGERRVVIDGFELADFELSGLLLQLQAAKKHMLARPHLWDQEARDAARTLEKSVARMLERMGR